MTRYPDPSVLQLQARALRREALSGIAQAAAIKWKALLDAASNAPHPRKGPAPSHP
jgi:hypothetical protein